MKKLIILLIAVFFVGCVSMQPSQGVVAKKRVSGYYCVIHLEYCNEPLQDSGQVIVSRYIYDSVNVGDYVRFTDIDRCMVYRRK